MTLGFDNIKGLVETGAKIIGFLTAIGGGYAALGGPLPATRTYVDGKVGAVVGVVSELRTDVLEGQLGAIENQRGFLSNERTILMRTVDQLDQAAQTVVRRRLAEIEVSLRKLERKETDTTDKLKTSKK